jgi:hypothetical protein
MSHALSILVLGLVLAAPIAASAQQQAAVPQGALAAPAVEAPSYGPGVVFRLSVGGQVGEILMPGGLPNALLLHGRLGLFVGHDLAAGYDGGVLSISLGYAGSLSVNHVEVVQRHGIGLSAHLRSVILTLAGGATFAHAYRGGMAAGGHVRFEPGFQFGNFTMTFPCEADFFPAGRFVLPAMTAGIAFGGATN